MDQLWDSLHDLFATDDGSLPDIYVLNLSASGVKSIWSHLRQLATGLAEGSDFWDIVKNQSVPVDSVWNAADLVVNGEAESFHAVLRGISLGEATIPDLGVFVFPDAIYIDYRMGPEWGPSQLAALFDLLSQLQAIEKRAVITLPQECTAEARARFDLAFADYRKAAAEQALGADSPVSDLYS